MKKFDLQFFGGRGGGSGKGGKSGGGSSGGSTFRTVVKRADEKAAQRQDLIAKRHEVRKQYSEGKISWKEFTERLNELGG